MNSGSKLDGKGCGERSRASRASGRSPVTSRYSLLASVLLAVSGCVSAPPEPDYSATWPDPAPSAAQANGAIYQAGHDIALFENAVARRVGDTLTIRLNERTNASKSSTTSTSKSTSIDMRAPTIAGRPVTAHGTEILAASVDNNAEFDGEGASTQ